MMQHYVADLHVHSLLSPCAAVEMTPRNIIKHAVLAGIQIIAITDHNACDNVYAAVQAAANSGVTVIPGMELETKEEVHIIVLFDSIKKMEQWNAFIQPFRSGQMNDETRFGAQYVVDADDELVRVKPELLLTAMSIGVAAASREAAALGGVCIASHVDRPVYSLISQLGLIPADASLAAVEVSRRMKPEEAPVLLPAIGRLPVVTASDAHTIRDLLIGPRTVFCLEQPTLAEIAMALAGKGSRKFMA
ncbi:MAG: PHP domain-containing protein [Veillonellales bacterium]